VPRAFEIGDLTSVGAQISGPDWRFAVSTGNIEHILRLAQSRIAAVQRAHQSLAFNDRRAQMRGAGREIGMV